MYTDADETEDDQPPEYTETAPDVDRLEDNQSLQYTVAAPDVDESEDNELPPYVKNHWGCVCVTIFMQRIYDAIMRLRLEQCSCGYRIMTTRSRLCPGCARRRCAKCSYHPQSRFRQDLSAGLTIAR